MSFCELDFGHSSKEAVEEITAERTSFTIPKFFMQKVSFVVYAFVLHLSVNTLLQKKKVLMGTYM